MRDLNRLSQLAREAGAYERDPLATVEPPRRDSIATSLVDQEVAKEQLISRRKGSVYYKDPNKQKRNVFRSKKEKAALTDTDRWTFTKAERFAELDNQIRQRGQVSLAQAILTASFDDALDVNNSYTSDQKNNTIATGQPNGWLDLVAERDDVEYVRLLTTNGANQKSKDQALGKALRQRAIHAVQELLRNDADPNVAGVEYFMDAIAQQDTQWINVFLTSIIPLKPTHINEALIATVGKENADLVALLLAHGANGNYSNGLALCTAIAGERLEDAATILFHSNDALSEISLENATEAACVVQNDTLKHRFLEMLLCAGADPNTPGLTDQLLQAVENNDLPFADLLIRHGTSPDHNNAENLRLAIRLGKTELVTILLRGYVSESSASRALDETNTLEETEDYEEIIAALVEKGVSKQSLHKCLADAVAKGCGPSLAPMLISHGANLEYADALCVRTALQQNNFSVIGVLLKGQCDPSMLCKVVPDALKIRPQFDRLHVMRSLLEKGVSGKELHIALQSTVGDSDYELMDLLIRKNASVDFSDHNGNCLCIAVAQENERALDILIEGDPSPDTASVALGNLPVSFAKSDAAEYEKSVRIASALLGKGAYGAPAAEMLIQAVRDDYRGKALDLLLNHGADANHNSGRAVEEALRLPKVGALEQLCRRSKLEKATFDTQLLNALKVDGFSFEKASMLVHTALRYRYEGILDMPLLQEVQVNGSRKEVIELFIGLGANVNFHEGEALRHAVSKGDVQTTRLLLPAKPTTKNVARAFPATMQIKDRSIRYGLMQLLLDSGGPGMGNEALLQASREADPEDLSHVELLLQHKANPNFNDGTAVLESIKAKNLPLLDLFVSTNLNKTTLTNAFNLARKVECSREERYHTFTILLKSGFQGFATSPALIDAVDRLPTDIETSVLLLQHGASVDARKGAAMQLAAAAGSLQLLSIFLHAKPKQESRDAAFQAAMSAHFDVDTRRAVYATLLETSISLALISRALFETTYREPIDRSLLSLLIKYGASLDAENGGAIHNATTGGDMETLSTLLIGSVSQKATLDKSFAACMNLEGETRWAIAKQLLEKQPGVNTKMVSHHLAQIVREKDHNLLRLLMKCNPKPTYNGGESLVLAAQAGDDTATAMLAAVEIPKEILNKAFEAMLDKRTIQSTPSGLKTASILLALGIEQSLVDRALLDGFDDPIDQKTKHLVELLIPFKPDFSGNSGKVFVVTACSRQDKLFRRMASQKPGLNVVIPSLISSFQGGKDVWEDEEEMEGEVTEQPQEGIQAEKKQPKVEVVEVHPSEDSQEEDGTLREPLEEKGMVSEEPCKEQEPAKETEEMTSGESPKEAQEDRPKTKQTSEVKLVSFLRYLEEGAERGDNALDDSVIFDAMTAFPQGKLLVKHLLDHGCPANSKIDAEADPSGEVFRYEPRVGNEKLTALVWALSSEEPKISEEIILEILETGREAGISYGTPVARHSVTHIAAATGYCTVLKRLIELDVDSSQLDSYEHTPSFYASRNGHKEAVEILHAAGARVNDSSLQEAAREAHPEIVKFLLANGHRANFPSGLHADDISGRTALEELCLKSIPGEDIDGWKARVHRCIEQLLPKTVKDMQSQRTDGKTILHLALENRKSMRVTRALLRFPAVWENINDPLHLFQDNQGYFYSPTKYVETFCSNANHGTKQQLLSLLRANKCADKFYAHTVDQPDGAIGLPEDIAFAVDKQKRADHEHREAIKRQDDLAARNRAIETDDYQRRLATDKERHNLLLRQQREQEDTEKAIAQRTQTLARAHAQELQRERQAALIEENRMKQQAISEEASRRRAIQDSELAAELAHKRAMASQEYAAMESRLQMERTMISEREKADRRQADRTMEVLARREQTARIEAQSRASGGYDYN